MYKMKTLLIVGHPYYKNSFANRIIVQYVQKKFDKNLEVRNLIELYPDYKINVANEQKYLLNSDLIVLQFPIFWASIPAILKLWIDEVFTNDFAYGKVYKLKGKKIMVSTTLSGDYNRENLYNVENKILFPILGLANFCKMEYLSPLILFNVDKKSKIDIIKHADLLVLKIKQMIATLQAK